MSKEVIVKKAYQINLGKIEEGFLYSLVSCHAENRSKAKKILLDMIKYDGYIISATQKEVDLFNIPVVRMMEGDLIEFEGAHVSRHKIPKILEERARNKELDSILENASISHCYIRKRGSYYRPGSCGYTEFKTKAGVYLKEDAISLARSCDELVIIPIDIEKHNKDIKEEIENLMQGLIIV